MKNRLLSLFGTALLVACSGADGAKGDKGDPGTPDTENPETDPSAGLVFPNKGLLAREVDVVLTVNDVKLEDSATLDFGAGIEVSDVVVTSKTALTAHLKIAETAVLGKHDVTIKSGANTLTAKSAFNVLPTVGLKVEGTTKQGGLVRVTLTNNDSVPFDDDFKLDDIDDGIITVSGGPSGTTATFTLVVTPKAATGKVALVGLNGSGLAYYADPDGLDIGSATPKDFTSPVAAENVASDLDAKSYKAAIPAAGANGQIYSLSVSVPKTSALKSALVLLYGSSGTFSSFFGQASTPDDPENSSIFGSEPLPPPYEINFTFPSAASAAATEKFFQVLPLDGKGTVDIKSTIFTENALAAEVATAHATAAAAQDLGALPAPTAGGAIVTGELTTATEKDVYKLTAAAGDLLEIAFTGAPEADVSLTDNALGAGEDDPIFAFAGNAAGGAASSTTTTALVAGDLDSKKKVFIVVSPYASSATKTGKYTLSVRKLPAVK